tara:strand:+ start:103 stop:633 length:531 start_codon:yes stop_codon:yes gene_type:complete
MIRIQDYVKCYDNILDLEICKKIIKEDTHGFEKAATRDGTISSYRKCHMKRVDDKFESLIYKTYGNILGLYIKEFKNFETGLTCEDTGYTHLLYKGEENGEYKEHVDHYDLHPRVLSCSIILNDDYEGGDFSFFNGEHIIPKKTASCIVFPSNFCFPHSVTRVTKGDRHAIITWFH